MRKSSGKIQLEKALLWMTWWIFQFSILSLCRVAADGEVSCTTFIAMFRCSSQIRFFFRGSMNISRLVPSSESRVIIIENKWEISSSSACSSAQQFNVKFRVSSRVIFLSSILFYLIIHNCRVTVTRIASRRLPSDDDDVSWNLTY